MLQQRLPQCLMLAGLVLSNSGLALAHTLGRGPDSGPTPPLKAYLDEIRALAQELPNGSVGVRGVLDQFKLWPVRVPVSVCFSGGQQLRATFVQTSLLWTPGTSLKFDFGDGPNYRTCGPDDKSNIRVSFARGGNWSYIGTDSRHAKGTTLNIGYAASVPVHMMDMNLFRELVLHEVGHAIGFEHEHQSPESKCEQEFDWPKVYDYARTSWGWIKPNGEVDKEAVDVNLRALTSSERLRTTAYDRESIMHYFFEAELFKAGRNSPCFVGHNQVLSRTDKELVGEAYPTEMALQDEHLQKRANVASAALAPMKLTAPQLSRVGRQLGRVLGAAPRKIILDFDLARASGQTRTRGAGDMKVCQEGQALGDRDTVIACEVATDASALVIAVEPR